MFLVIAVWFVVSVFVAGLLGLFVVVGRGE
jgi:hypothetical protein